MKFSEATANHDGLVRCYGRPKLFPVESDARLAILLTHFIRPKNCREPDPGTMWAEVSPPTRRKCVRRRYPDMTPAQHVRLGVWIRPRRRDRVMQGPPGDRHVDSRGRAMTVRRTPGGPGCPPSAPSFPGQPSPDPGSSCVSPNAQIRAADASNSPVSRLTMRCGLGTCASGPTGQCVSALPLTTRSGRNAMRRAWYRAYFGSPQDLG